MLYIYTAFRKMKIIPIKVQAGLLGFEAIGAEYNDLELSLDDLLIEKPSATWIGLAQGRSLAKGSKSYIGRHESNDGQSRVFTVEDVIGFKGATS